MISKTPEERRYYQSRLKMQRDEAARLEAALERGRAEGEARGRAEGEVIGRVKLLQSLIGLPESTDDELRARPTEELAQLESDLQRQLRDRA